MKVKARIEIPAGSLYKYEFKKGKLVLDRPLSVKVPTNYGYVINTLAEDADPLDIFVISNQPIQPGALVEVELVSGYYGTDGGVEDHKLIGRLANEEPQTPWVTADFEIYEYLTTYKAGYQVLDNMFTRARFKELLDDSRKRFKSVK